MPVRPLLLHRMALVSFRLYDTEKFGQLARIFWANGLPPPWQKISRTPMSGSLGSRACMDWPRKKTMQGWKFVTQKEISINFSIYIVM